MFYFFVQVFVSLSLILTIFYIYNKKEITNLENLIILFIFNICMFCLYQNIGILYMIFLSIFILLSYYLYKFLQEKKINEKVFSSDKVLINRGLINFQELVKENYSYESLLYNLKKKGISSPNLVDYCIKRNNDLIIFRKNSVKNYPISLIIDGNILKDNLFSIHKTVEWLDKKLNENNLELNNINYAYFKNKEVYFITN